MEFSVVVINSLPMDVTNAVINTVNRNCLYFTINKYNVNDTFFKIFPWAPPWPKSSLCH